MPAANPIPGSYDESKTVTLTAEAGATIYYTVATNAEPGSPKESCAA